MDNSAMISTAEDLVRGMAHMVSRGDSTLDDVYDLIMDCSDGDTRLATVVRDKTETQLAYLECQPQALCS